VDVIHKHGRSWGGSEADEVVSVHQAAFRYFGKYHRGASALTLRLLALVMLPVRMLWSALVALFPSDRDRALRDLKTRWVIFRTALGFAPRCSLEPKPATEGA